MNDFTDYTKMPIEGALKEFNKWPALFLGEKDGVVTCSMMRVPRPVLQMLINDAKLHTTFFGMLNSDPVGAWHYLKQETGFGFSPFSEGDHKRLLRTGQPPQGAIISRTHISNLSGIQGEAVTHSLADKVKGFFWNLGRRIGMGLAWLRDKLRR